MVHQLWKSKKNLPKSKKQPLFESSLKLWYWVKEMFEFKKKILDATCTNFANFIINIIIIIYEINCAIYTNLHELFCQFIIWTNWVNSGKFMGNCWISRQVMADMEKFNDDLIIINLQIGTYLRCTRIWFISATTRTFLFLFGFFLQFQGFFKFLKGNKQQLFLVLYIIYLIAVE